ncbi:hypothetical protein GJ744_010450 [Endocarpon pusillum]|uniref:ETS domain-containing protein n=1 Tax=Endocarpon pusillum TaxID=364733 RepID=A0A8H7AHU4_9EURO|nr:hypothetical protein GJ744_010450 [Endocarpon pusillum]
MDSDVSSRHMWYILCLVLVLGPPWLEEKYDLPLSLAVSDFILRTCLPLKQWLAIGYVVEFILPTFLSTLRRPVDLFYPDVIRDVQDRVSFWYWYYVEDVATEDLYSGWSVRGRLRVTQAFLMLFLRSLFSKLGTWRTSRYFLKEQPLCGKENSEKEFIHTPLEASHFRLLRLDTLPSQNGFPKCELSAIPLEDTTSTNIAYKCLSYRWGSEDKTHSILLNNCSFGVSQSLWEFLNVYQRRSDKNTHLWIDQICINQADVREKNDQVNQMGRIYEQCKEVIVWLGTCSKSSIGRALHFLHAIQSPRGSAFWTHNHGRCFCLKESNCMLRRSTSDHNQRPHPALQALLSNPYWSRAWIVQEIILAPRAKIVCGPYSIDYVVEKKGLLLQPHSREACGFRKETQHFFDLVYMHAQAQLHTPWNRQGLWRLQDAIQFVKSEARDVRDKVFALQGLVRPDQRIRVDYTLSKEELFQNLLIALFNHYHEPEMRGSPEGRNFAEGMGYLLDEFGLPSGLKRLFYDAEMIIWCLTTASFARRGAAFYARGEKHSFRAMSIVQIVEYLYNVADNLENPRTREWLASQGVFAKPNPDILARAQRETRGRMGTSLD